MKNMEKSLIIGLVIILLLNIGNIVYANNSFDNDIYFKLSKTKDLISGEMITIEYDLGHIEIGENTYIGFKSNDKKIVGKNIDIKIEENFNIKEIKVSESKDRDLEIRPYIYNLENEKEIELFEFEDININIIKNMELERPNSPVEPVKIINL